MARRRHLRKREHLFVDYPEYVRRVTAGVGGGAVLILGSEKIALLDCGMAYCAEKLLENIETVLEETGKPLAYIVATHSHYDHIGAMAAVKKRWPQAVICASEHAAKVFQRPGAIRLMEKLSRVADMAFSGESESHLTIDYEHMQVERILHEGDRITLGDRYLQVLETPGHTDCCLSYLLEPDHLIFLSETTGCVISETEVASQTLKNFEDTFRSVEKCRKYKDYRMVISHHGLIPEEFQETFWELLDNDIRHKISYADKYRHIINEQSLVNVYVKKFWTQERGAEQPYEAFCENAKHEMHAALMYLEELDRRAAAGEDIPVEFR